MKYYYNSLSTLLKAGQKKIAIMLFFLLFSVLGAQAQVSVTATAGTAGPTPYTTLKLAFDAINAGTHQGDVTISISASTTEGTTPATLNSSGSGTAVYTSVLIQPTADGVTISGNPATGFGVIQLKGADNVTINGDNPNTGGTNRDLTVANTAATTIVANSCIRIATVNFTGALSADNITIKNCNLNGNVTSGNASAITSATGSSTISFGIYVGGNGGASAIDAPTAITSGLQSAPASTTINGLIIDNNAINQCGRGISFIGAAAAQSTGITITNNVIGDQSALTGIPPYNSPATTVYSKGIIVSGTTAVTITGNTIKNIISYVGVAASGIELLSAIGTGTINVSSNTVSGVVINVANALSARGISIANAGAPYTVNFNTISNVQNFCNSTTTTNRPIGLFLGTSAASATVNGNRISQITDRNAGTFGVSGVLLNSGNNITFSNNFVSDVNEDISGGAAFNITWGVSGVSIIGGTGHKIYHNTIALSGAFIGTSTSSILSASLLIGATGQTGLDVRNNILSNTMTSGTTSIACVPLFLPSGATSAMNLTLNNNAYFTGTDAARQGIAQAGTTAGTNFFTLAGFNPAVTTGSANLRTYSNTLRATSGNDDSSLGTSTAAPFISSTNFLLDTANAFTQPNLFNKGAAAVLAFVNTDIQGEARPQGAATNPTIGADEVVYTGCATASSGTITPSSASRCFGFTYTMNGTGATVGAGITYQWKVATTSGGALSNVTGGTGATTPTYITSTTLAAGTYYFKLETTCSNGPVVALSNEFVLTVNALPNVAVTPTAGNYCTATPSPITLTASGALSYTWNGTGTPVLSATTGNPVTSSPTSNTVITVTGTDANTCTNTATATIVSSSNVPVVTINPASVSLCASGTTTLTASANDTSLAGALAAINSNSAALIASVPGATSFPMDGTGGVNGSNLSDGCSDMFDTGNVLNTNLASTIVYSDNVITNNAAAFGTGGKYFTRYIGTSGCAAGPATIFYWGADVNGLTSVSITGNLGADGSGSQDLNTFTVSSGGVTYNCYLKRVYAATDPSINTLFMIPQPTTATQAMGASTDDNLHSITGLTGVTRVYYMLYAGAAAAQISVANATAIAQTFANTVSPNTTYSWNTGDTTAAITVSPTVDTTYTVTASSGCTSAPVSATVTVGATLVGQAATYSAITCNGSNFTVTANHTGGGAPFHYAWSNGVNATSYPDAKTITANLPAGTYPFTCTVTDACSGSTTSNVSITVNPLPTVAITPTPANAKICGSGTVSMTASGAATYVWSPTTALTPSNGLSATEVSAATVTTAYSVIGTDSNGCVSAAPATQTVTVGPAVTMASVTATPSTICTGTTSVLSASASSNINYSVASTTFGLLTPTGTPTVLCTGGTNNSTGNYTSNASSLDDGIWDNLTLPFPFTFYGVTNTTFRVSTNGNIQFGPALVGTGTAASYNWVPETIPSTTSINNYIGCPWMDHDPSGTPFGTIRYFTNGTTPNRQFVVSYEAVKVFNISDLNTAQIILNESDNTVEIHLGGGGLAASSVNKAMGIEGPGGTLGTAAPGRNLGTWQTTANEAWKFTPGAVNYAWTPATGLTPSASVSNPTTPALSATTTYNVTATEAGSGCFATGSVTVTTTNVGPAITTDPVSIAKCTGGNATFTVVATGANLSYQWRRGTTPLANGGTISGATSASLVITGLVAGDAGTDYNVVISSPCGADATSNNATLTLNDITASVSPTTASVCGPQLLTVTTAASPASYVWSRNGAVIASATTATYSATEQGTYTVVVTGGAGSCVAPAATATIFIKANPSAVTMDPTSASVCLGQSVTLGASATNTNTTVLREDFNGTVNGFTTTNASTGGTPANAAWALYISGASVASNDNSNFVLTNSNGQAGGVTATTLKTPAMDLSTYTAASLSFYQFFAFNSASDTAKVEVSTDNSSWTTLATYTSNQGTGLAWTQTTFNLTPYTGAGKTTVYIRFKYDATLGLYWGIDNLLVTGTSTPSATWSPSTELYSSLTPLTPYGGEPAGGVFAIPTADRTYTATATAANGCFTTNTVAVTTKALPTFAVSDKSLCSDNASGVDVSPTGGDSANTYVWSPTSNLLGGNISVDGTSTNADVIHANPASTASYSVVANNNTTGCSSPPHPFTVTVSPQAVITASTASRVKSPGTSTTFVVTATNAAAYQWQVSADGGEYVSIDGSYTPVNGESYSNATTATLTISNIAIEMNGYTYRCLVKGAGDCTFVTPNNTQEGTLQVLDIGFAPNVPADASVCETGTALFSVTTTGGTPENYAWQMSTNNGAFVTISNGVDAPSGFTFSGADTANLTVSTITYSATNTYRFLCTVNDESVSSEIALLNINKTIAGTQDPQTNLGLCSLGSTSTFTAKATGTISGAQWQYSTSASGPWSNVSNGTPANVTYSPSLSVAGSTDGERTASLAVSSNATTPVSGGPYFYKAVFQRANAVCSDFETPSGELDITNPTLNLQPVSGSVIVTNSKTFTAGIADPLATYQWQYSTSPSSGFQDIPTGSQTGASYSGANTATLTVTTSGATPLVATNYYRARVTSSGCIAFSNAAQLTVTNYCAPTYVNGPGTTNQITKVTLGTLVNNSGASVNPFYTFYSSVTIPDLIKLSTASVQVVLGSDANQFTGVWIDFNQNGTFEASEGVVSSTNAGSNGTSTLSVLIPSTATVGQTRMRVRGGDDAAMLTSQACGATNSVAGETEDYLVNVIATPAPTITSLGAASACAGTSITINGTNLYGAVASGVTVNGVAVSSITSNTGSVLIAVIDPTTPAGTGTNLISVTAAGGVTPSSPTFTVNAAPVIPVVTGGGNTCAASVTLTASNGGSGTMYYQGITSNGTSTATPSSSQVVTTSGTYYFRAQSAGGCWSPQGSAVVTFYTNPSSITVTPAAPSACSGAITALTANGGFNAGVSSTLGTGTGFTASATEHSAFNNRRINYVGQTIYTAADLTAAGVVPGNITSLAYNINDNGSATNNTNYTVKIGHIGSQTVFATTAFVSNAAYTTVFGPTTYVHAAPGWQTITFTTPFLWNGVDNICIDVRSTGIDSSSNAQTQFTTTPGNSTIFGFNTPATGTFTTSRLNIRLGTFIPPANPMTWSPTTDLYTDAAGTIPYTGTTTNVVYAKRTSTGTYTVTATNPGGCSTTQNVTVTVDVLAATAVTTTGNRCTGGDFTATANRTGGGAPFHYSWNDGVGGSYPDAATVTVNKPAGTYNFDVTITDNCGGTVHSTASITVNALPTISVAPTPATARICGTGSVSMAVTTSAPSFTWSPTTNLTPTTGSPVVANPAATTTYTATTAADANGCVNSVTQTVTVGPAVTLTTVAATPAAICSGSTSALSAVATTTPALGYTVAATTFGIQTPTGTPTVLCTNGTNNVTTGFANSASNLTALDDAYWNNIALPFPFTFYGVSNTTIRIATNGNVQFGAAVTGTTTTTSVSWTPETIPTVGGNLNNFIGCPWMDHDPGTSPFGTIRYFTNGTAPNRQFIVSYEAVKVFNITDLNTAQIILNENGNTVEIHLGGGGLAASAVNKAMGIEGPGGTLGTAAPGRNLGTWQTTANEAWKFTQQALSYTWNGTNSFSSNLQNPTTPTLTADATYNVVATETASGCFATGSTTVTVNTLSVAPTSISGTTTVCSGTQITLTQVGGTLGTGATYKWYTGSCGGTLVGSGPSFTVTPTATTTYYVLAQGTCNTTTCASVTVTVNTPSVAPTSITGVNGVCSGTSTTLTAAGGTLGTGATYKWYTGSCGGTLVNSGATLTVSPTTTTTYYVRAEGTCNTTTCASMTVSVTNCAVTQLSNCGNIPALPSVNTRIFAANTISSASGYRFRVAVSTAPTTYFYAFTANPSFRLTDVVGLTPAYGTTYNVDIQTEYLVGATTITTAYGPMCSVTTQAATNITVPTNQCGQTLAAINSKIYVNGVTGATMYTYRIAKQSAPTVFGYIETPYSNFRLTAPLTSGAVAIEHNTVYLVAVSVTTANGSSNFNGECQITTPAGPVTTLQASQCGDDDAPYVVPTKSTKVYAADFVSGATYTFKLEQYDAQSNLVATKFATSPINYFDCNMFTGINSLLPNTKYHVYVSINYYGSGPYDHDCVIQTPAALKQVEVTQQFTAVAYPNPFANNFMVDVKSSSQSVVNLKVYDMIGRLIEQRDVRMSDLETTTIGDRYPSGVYNVVVSQESSVETVRVVKR